MGISTVRQKILVGIGENHYFSMKKSLILRDKINLKMISRPASRSISSLRLFQPAVSDLLLAYLLPRETPCPEPVLLPRSAPQFLRCDHPARTATAAYDDNSGTTVTPTTQGISTVVPATGPRGSSITANRQLTTSPHGWKGAAKEQ